MSEFQLPAAFKGGPPVSAAAKALNMEKLGAGVEASFGVIKMAGKVWSLQYRGKNYPFMRPDGDGPRGFLDVVFLRAAENKAKTYYKKFVQGQKEKPICWSNNSVTPDAAVPPENKQAAHCATCPMNQVSAAHAGDDGKPRKACRDHKRTAVFIDPVIVKTVMDEQIDGPVMLRIPAASLNDLATFGENMDAQGFPAITYVTRIGFDPKVTYQKLTFSAERRLSDAEVDTAIEMRNNPLTERIINAPPPEEGETVVAAPAREQSSPSGSFARPNASGGHTPPDNVVELKPNPPTPPEAAPPPTVQPLDAGDFSVAPDIDAKLDALLKN